MTLCAANAVGPSCELARPTISQHHLCAAGQRLSRWREERDGPFARDHGEAGQAESDVGAEIAKDLAGEAAPCLSRGNEDAVEHAAVQSARPASLEGESEPEEAHEVERDHGR